MTRKDWPLCIDPPRANGQQVELLPDLMRACREWRRRRERERLLLSGVLGMAWGCVGAMIGSMLPFGSQWFDALGLAILGVLFGWWLGWLGEVLSQ